MGPTVALSRRVLEGQALSCLLSAPCWPFTLCTAYTLHSSHTRLLSGSLFMPCSFYLRAFACAVSYAWNFPHIPMDHSLLWVNRRIILKGKSWSHTQLVHHSHPTADHCH